MSDNQPNEDIASGLRSMAHNIWERLPPLRDKGGHTRSDAFAREEVRTCVQRAALDAFKATANKYQLDVDPTRQDIRKYIEEQVLQSESLSRLNIHFSSLARRDQGIRDEKKLIRDIELQALRRRLRYRVYTAAGIALVILGTSAVADYADIALPFMRMANPAAALVP